MNSGESDGVRMIKRYVRGIANYLVDSILTTTVLFISLTLMALPLIAALSWIFDIEPVVVAMGFALPVAGLSIHVSQRNISKESTPDDESKTFAERRLEEFVSFVYLNAVLLLAVVIALAGYFVVTELVSVPFDPLYVLLISLFIYPMLDLSVAEKAWWASPGIMLSALVVVPLHVVGSATWIRLSALPLDRVVLVEMWDDIIQSRGGITP